MRKRFKLPLSFIGLMITGCIILFISYYLYYEVLEKGEIVVDAPLSINFEETKTFDENNYQNIKFSVTNDGAIEEYYFVLFNQVEYSENISFELLYENNLVKEGLIRNEQITDYISIMPGETHEYILNIDYNNQGLLSGEIVIKKVNELSNTLSSMILKNNEIKDSPITKIGSEVALLDEGLIKSIDDYGDAYYFRGSVTNNYVNFAEYKWRVVKINGDGSIKLVLNDVIDTLSTYSDDVTSYKESSIKTIVDNWYEINLFMYADLITNHNFCNDNSIVDSKNNIYAAYNRVVSDNIASYNCLGDDVNAKVGLLTVDEVLYAGANVDEDNTDYYLYNDNIEDEYFLMSSAKTNNSGYYPFLLDKNGKIVYSTLSDLSRGVRPVINIIKNAPASGSGTVSDPYVITK